MQLREITDVFLSIILSCSQKIEATDFSGTLIFTKFHSITSLKAETQFLGALLFWLISYFKGSVYFRWSFKMYVISNPK
jgi:hypothetical protein